MRYTPARSIAIRLIFIFACLGTAWAQGLFSPVPSEPLAMPQEKPGVPRTFRNLSLGMSMEAVKEVLAADGLFAYRGDPDVSLLPRPNEKIGRASCRGRV